MSCSAYLHPTSEHRWQKNVGKTLEEVESFSFTLPKTYNEFAPENRPTPKRKGFFEGTTNFSGLEYEYAWHQRGHIILHVYTSNNISMIFISVYTCNHDTTFKCKNTKLHTNHQKKQEESFQNHILRSHHWPCHYRHDPSFGKPIRVGGRPRKGEKSLSSSSSLYNL